jgi:hypothetical protein
MFRLIIFILVITPLVSVKTIAPHKITVTKPVTKDSIQIPVNPSGNYLEQRQAILNKRNNFRQLLYRASNAENQKKILDSAGKYLSETIVSDLIPHWYGTLWSFEGYTEIPKQGTIACGYFVSTVLQHAGFNLNRYKMAQQNPECEVLTLHQQPDYIIFKAETPAALSDSVKLTLKEGLYIFGKENHVGFMLYQKGQVYLIHSNYQVPAALVKPELLQDSGILQTPPYIFFGEISTNHKLIKQWLSNQPIVVVLPENGK